MATILGRDNLKKTTKDIIEKSFPLLKHKKLYLYTTKSKKYVGGATKLPFINVIRINKKLLNDNQYLIGVLSHELSHLERFTKMGWIKYFFVGISYWINGSARTKEEMEVNKLSIRKGYAKELYYAMVKNEQNPYAKKIRKYYMTPSEIKSYAIKIKKWQQF